MPITPREDQEGVRTRSQTAADTTPAEDAAASGTQEFESHQLMTQTPALDLNALMTFMQEQARRQEEQMQEQARRQEEQARRQEEQAQEHARRQEEQQQELMWAVRESNAKIKEKLDEVNSKIEEQDQTLGRHEERLNGLESKISEEMEKIKTCGVTVSSSATAGARFKVPPFDGLTSWAAYKLQFESVVIANGWNENQARTALTLGLRDKALHVLEALGPQITYDGLLEALESRFGDKHLEHVYRAQLRDRVQRASEGLQQWALEIEKLVRKAHQSSSKSSLED